MILGVGWSLQLRVEVGFLVGVCGSVRGVLFVSVVCKLYANQLMVASGCATRVVFDVCVRHVHVSSGLCGAVVVYS